MFTARRWRPPPPPAHWSPGAVITARFSRTGISGMLASANSPVFPAYYAVPRSTMATEFTACPLWGTARRRSCFLRGLRQYRVHRLHDRDGLVKRHQRALRVTGGQPARDLIGLVTQAAALVHRLDPDRIAVARNERHGRGTVEVALDLDPRVGADVAARVGLFARRVQVSTAWAPLS